MTSRERVRRAITFTGPDRIPYQLPDPWGGDLRWTGFDSDPNWKPSVPGMDEWGSVWETLDSSMGQVKRPAVADWSDLDKVRWPEFVTPERTKSAREAVKQDDDRFVLASIPNYLWERMNRMRGIENALADLCAYPEETEHLLDRIAEEALKQINFFGEIGADGIISCEDWGLQKRLMINPATWRRIFKPRYAQLFGRAHEHGMFVVMHSCGYIVDILEDLIEVGLDLIELDQQEHMGIDLLSERFGGRLAFWCPVDIQQTMVYGTIEDVRNYARRMMWQFGRFNGGYIGFWYGSPKAVNHDMAKVNAMAEVFATEGTYPLRPPPRAAA